MKSTTISILLLLSIGYIITQSADSCEVSSSSKRDCGHPGTQQPDCEASDCCWMPVQSITYKRFLESSITNVKENIPWCYKKSSAPDFCKSFNWKTSEIGFDQSFYDKMYKLYTDN